MLITAVQLYRYRLPLAKPLTLAGNILEYREGLLVKLESDTGATGWGDAAVLPGFSRETEAEVAGRLSKLKSTLPGYTPANGFRVDDLVPPGLELVGAVRCAVEMALANLIASKRNTSLAQILGEKSAPNICQNALLTGTVDTICTDAGRLKRTGYSAFKLKVGRQSVEADIDLVRKVRGVIGPAATLRLDANRAWSISEAERFAVAVAECRPEYIEEPTKDPSELPDLVRRTSVPVALDESLQDIDASFLAEHIYARALVLKPPLVGGFSRVIRLANEGMRLGMLPVISASFESGIGMAGLVALASTILDGSVPAGLDTYRWLAKDVLKHRLPLEGGSIAVEQVLTASKEVDMHMLEEIR